MNSNFKVLSFIWLFSLFIIGCGSNTTITDSNEEASSSFDWKLPSNVYPPRVPQDNPMSNEKVALGRFLFYDTQLSANQTQSCSSCHLQDLAFSDRNKVGIGSTGEHSLRNPNSLTNTGYYTSYSWANPALGTLERFIILPIRGDDPIELGVVPEKENEVMARFENNATYQKMFEEAFPQEAQPISMENIVKALASFNRMLNSFNAPYDKFLRGDSTALSVQERRGMDLFMGEKAECFHCHDGISFSDSTANEKSFTINQFFHNIGLYNVGEQGTYPEGNQGLYETTMNQADQGKFKAPTLRNIELTAPYMHDGSMATLEEILELHSNGGRDVKNGVYAGNGITNPFKSDFITVKDFTQQEKDDLIAFLKSLTDDEFINNPDISNPFKEQ
ncbi:MAG: Cytochrome C peroxidase [uncultured Sulfurovum sp.]|uniref:Cytochrome C peroxidase n=1 Tax=uncultured Sulfurovum sp. TaxID=269237 RepID=A0A6S6TCC8_9BACT|nr:MAG: Cytochrome C peroxidase [uncultured Sulfurovum sp.]